MAAGVAPARTNSPAAATTARASGTMTPRSPEWLMPRAARITAAPPAMPYAMIVVRRIVLNRSPQYSRPAKNRAPPIASPTLIWIGSKPPISCLVGELRVGLLHQLEDRLGREQAEDGVDGDPGRRQQPDVAAAQDLEVAAEVDLLGRGARAVERRIARRTGRSRTRCA